jgi:hypothetical protein
MFLRGYLGVACRILLLSLVFVLVFVLTGLVIALLLSWVQSNPFAEEINVIIGMMCGLIAWLFIAVFHLRRETVYLPFNDPFAFLEQVQATLNELGYELKSRSPTILTFRPSFRAFLLGGGGQVALEEHSARITGPRICLEWLRKRMRIRNHLDNLSRTIQEDRRRQGERYLKRVQISLRFPAQNYPEVFRHVVAPLAELGSVLCDLNLLAQSDSGIPENLIDFQVRPWLLGREIPPEIHKDFVQREEPPRLEPVDSSEEISV